MKALDVRLHGNPPYHTALVHGGPGAAGEMAPVAAVLGRRRGVVEPIQTARSLQGQVEELCQALRCHADLPAVLIGFSWGAWLSFLLTAYYPSLVRKLILVGSPPFEERYVDRLRNARLERLGEQDSETYEKVVKALEGPATGNADLLLMRLGQLARKADTWDPLPHSCDQDEPAGRDGAIYRQVWLEAAELRRSGALLRLGREILCPVIAIHGDYDPHPSEGVQKPLSSVLESFRFILLRQCGHKPWIERQARDAFFQVLEATLP